MALYHGVGSAIRNDLAAETMQTPIDGGGRVRLFWDTFEVGTTNVPTSVDSIGVTNENPLVVGNEFIPKGCRIVGGFLSHADMSTQSSGILRIKLDVAANVGTGSGAIEMYTHRTHLIDHRAAADVHILLPWEPATNNPHYTVIPSDYVCWMMPQTTGRFNIDGATMSIAIMYVMN